MKIRDNKGSITVFVLVGLLFMVSFLVISYGSNISKSKIAKDQLNSISSIYSHGDGDASAYERAYTAIRKRNAQVLTETVEAGSSLELTKTFNDKLSNYKIYGNSIQNTAKYGTPSSDNPVEIQSVGDKTNNLFDKNISPIFTSDSTITSTSTETGLILTNGKDGAKWCSNVYKIGNVEAFVNKTLYFKAKAQLNQATSGAISIGYADSDGSNRVVAKSKIFTQNGDYVVSIAVDAETYVGKVVCVWLYCNASDSVGSVSGTSIEYSNIMFSVDDYEYEPYGKYKIPVRVSGKNLVNQNNFSVTNAYNVTIEETSKYYDVSTAINTNGIMWNLDETFSVGDKITFQAKVKYISAAGDEDDSVTLRIWNATKSMWIHAGSNGLEKEWSTIIKGQDKYLTLTTTLTEQTYTPGDIIQVKISRGIKSLNSNLVNFYVYKDTIIVQRNDTEVTYEPYVQPQIVNIYLYEPLRKVGNYKDYIDFATGKVVRNVRNINLNIADMNNNEDYPGWINQSVMKGDYDSKNVNLNTLTSVMTNITNTKPVGINTLRTGAIFLTKSVYGLSQTEWIEQYPNLQFRLCYGLQSYEEKSIDLPELSTYEDYTKIEVLTEIAPSKIEATYYGYTME